MTFCIAWIVSLKEGNDMKAIKRYMKDQILTDDKKILHCPGCDAEYSGNKGDYWNLPEDYVFTCKDCKLEMELVIKTTFVEYGD